MTRRSEGGGGGGRSRCSEEGELRLERSLVREEPGVLAPVRLTDEGPKGVARRDELADVAGHGERHLVVHRLLENRSRELGPESEEGGIESAHRYRDDVDVLVPRVPDQVGRVGRGGDEGVVWIEILHADTVSVVDAHPAKLAHAEDRPAARRHVTVCRPAASPASMAPTRQGSDEGGQPHTRHSRRTQIFRRRDRGRMVVQPPRQ